MVISPALEAKIERRSRRAFRYLEEGGAFKIHRISDVKKDSLRYRIPRSGRKNVEVVRDDSGNIVVDPPTTGARDLRVKSDIPRLKNETGKIHIGEITAYMLTTTAKKVGKLYKKPDKLLSRAQCVDQIKAGERVFVVKIPPGNIDDVGLDHIIAHNFSIDAELDLVKDLGFTVGLYDCRTKGDVEKLRKKRHLGRVRAYKYVTKELESPTNSKKIKYEVGQDFEVKNADTNDRETCGAGINLASVDWCKSYAKGDQRALAFEFEMEDIAAIPTDGGKFRVHRCTCVEEVDPKTYDPIKPAEQDAKEDKKPKKKKKKKGFLGLFGGKDED